MMSEALAVFVLVSYVSLFVELFVMRVPSVASFVRIWAASQASSAGFSGRYRALIESHPLVKAVAAAVPLLAIYAVFLFPFIVLAGAVDPLDDYVWTPRPAHEVAAVALMIAGRALSLAAAIALMRDLGPGGEPNVLCTSGPFRWSRNPGLVGMYAFVGGLWIAMPSGLLMIAIAVYALHMDFKVRMEEDYLERRFGAVYRAYCASARRYI